MSTLEVNQEIWVFSFRYSEWRRATVMELDSWRPKRSFRIVCPEDRGLNWVWRAAIRTDDEHAARTLAL